jgi:hypothetical protein
MIQSGGDVHRGVYRASNAESIRALIRARWQRR